MVIPVGESFGSAIRCRYSYYFDSLDTTIKDELLRVYSFCCLVAQLVQEICLLKMLSDYFVGLFIVRAMSKCEFRGRNKLHTVSQSSDSYELIYNLQHCNISLF